MDSCTILIIHYLAPYTSQAGCPSPCLVCLSSFVGKWLSSRNVGLKYLVWLLGKVNVLSQPKRIIQNIIYGQAVFHHLRTNTPVDRISNWRGNLTPTLTLTLASKLVELA